MREDVSFYETSAQVIPVLLLATVLEARFLGNLRPFAGPEERKKHAPRDAIMLPIAVALVLAGEAAALHASLVGDANGAAELLTGVALLVGFWGVFTPILNEVIQASNEMLDEHAITGRGRRAAKATGKWTSKAIHVAIPLMGVYLLVDLVV
jgi:hypothetical protein